jgi:mRNA-degrading endonuclease RelE of RelBE toxin-antitoxin system
MSVRPEFAPYELALGKPFQKQLAHLSDQDATRVAVALQRLSLEGLGDIKDVGDDVSSRLRLFDDSHVQGLGDIKDVGDDMAGAFRLRVGSLRILFDLEAKRILVRSMEKRGEAYKKRSRNKRKS